MYRNEENSRVSTLYELAQSSLALFDVFTAVKEKSGEKYENYTYGRLFSDASSIGRALVKRGLASKHIVICGRNSYDWVRAYFAVAAYCGVSVPLSRKLSEDAFSQAVSYCNAECVIYGESAEELVASLPEGITKIPFSQLDSLVRECESCENEIDTYVPSPDDVAELAYTPGTDATPKAAVLTHRSICFVMCELFGALPLGNEDSTYSILPLSHAYERICGMLYPIYAGASVAYGEGLLHLTSNLRQTKPTVILCVPVVLEKIYEKIWKNIEKKGIGEKVRRVIKLSAAAGPLKNSVRRGLFAEIHDSLGGNLSYIISGGDVADGDTVSGFAEFGIQVLQCYGMTECASLISLNRPELYEDDSAGLPLSRGLADIYNIQGDGIGEIRYRGENVMKGYYNDDAATCGVLRGNWLYTGDMGYFDRRGFLHIVGRRVNMIRSSKQKQIFPEELERELERNPFVAQSVVVGIPNEDNTDIELVAVIHPEAASFEALYGADYTESPLRKELGNAIRVVNAGQKKYKHIHKFVIRKEPFLKNEAGKIIRAGIAEQTAAMLAKQ